MVRRPSLLSFIWSQISGSEISTTAASPPSLSLDRGGIVIGMPRKEARGHRRPDSVDRGRGGEGGDITAWRKKK